MNNNILKNVRDFFLCIKKSIIKFCIIFYAFLGGPIIFLLLLICIGCLLPTNSERKNRSKQQIIQADRSIQSYHEQPFVVMTPKDTFDLLDIRIKFIEHPEDFSYKNLKFKHFKEIWWIPKYFVLYDDGYYVWKGNDMDKFLDYHVAYPKSTFILFGSRCGKSFLTERVFIAW